MINKLREKLNIFIAKSPQKAVLIGIMLFNIVFMSIAAAILAVMSHYLSGLRESTFWEALYYTVTMILDAGCIGNLIEDVGSAGAVAAIICLAVVILGMVSFTGAVIGYVTNVIAEFIESNNNGRNKLLISDHIVILNWNSRGAEILNEFSHSNRAIQVVILTAYNKSDVEKEIKNCLGESTKNKNFTYIVRQGDVSASGDLNDISIDKAKTIIILDNGAVSSNTKGNIQTVKIFMQVSEICRGDNQGFVVEVNNNWTESLINNVTEFRGNAGRVHTTPFNTILGRMSAQVAIAPKEGATFDLNVREVSIGDYMGRGIAVIGHNSNMSSLMKWFDDFRKKLDSEGSDKLFKVVLMDDAESLERHNYYREYPFTETFNLNSYDEDELRSKIQNLTGVKDGQASILLLSDDTLGHEETDARVLTYLVYLQHLIGSMNETEAGAGVDKYTIIAEILNPENVEIVRKYGADKVLTGNKYIGKKVAEKILCTKN